MGVLEEKPEDYKPSIKGSFVEGTTHLKKSKLKGDDARNLVYKNMRLLLILAILAVVFWFLYLKQ